MKKVIYTIILFTIFMITPNALSFNIDMDKINISSSADELTKDLDNSYKIDTTSFGKKVVEDKKAEEIAIALTKIAKTKNVSKDDIIDYMYVSGGANAISSSILVDSYIGELNNHDLSYDRINNIRVIKSDEGILTFVYISNALVDNKKEDIVFTYWLKEQNNTYKLYYPVVNLGEDLEAYFNNITSVELEGNIIGESYNKVSLNNNSKDDQKLTTLFNNNKNKVVSISGLKDGGVDNFGNGFFIRKGIIVTTWTLLEDILNKDEYMYVNDSNNNTYQVDKVIAADTKYNVVILKLKEEVGEPVTLIDTDSLTKNETIYTINSKENVGFLINYGTYINNNDGIINNLLPLKKADQGSILLNSEGNVFGFNTSDNINSPESIAHSTDYLMSLQEKLNNLDFSSITGEEITNFKNNYYVTYDEEKEFNNVKDNIWDVYKKIGKLEDTINLDIIKKSYKNNILTIRYKNNYTDSLNTLYLLSDYIDELENEGYKCTYNSLNKYIYKNDKYKIIIKENMNYLIIIMMEV